MREDWIVVELGEVCNVYPGIGFPKTIQGKKEGKYPFFKVGDISKNVQAGNRKLDFCDNYIDDGDIKNIKSNIVPANTVVFAKIGEALKLNRRCQTRIDCLIDNNAIGIKAKKYFDDLYLYFFSLTIKLENYSRATTVPSVRKTDIEEINIPLAPLPIQRAIVLKIENLFASLDKGIADLKTAQGQLKVYRQAVLKKAFEGKLVSNHDSKDSPDDLDLKIEGKENQGHQENQNNQGSDNLPQGWKWVKLGEVAEYISDGDHQAPPKANIGIPFITISNIDKVSNKIDFSDTFFVNIDYYNSLKENRKPQKGDILYTVTGSFGIPVMIDFKKQFCFQRHIGLIRPMDNVDQKWLFYLLQTKLVYNQAEEKATGTAQKTVALSTLRNIQIPFCPLAEQHAIVLEIESRLSVCDKVEQNIAEALEKAEALRQSILKKAFEGKLLTEAEIAKCKQESDYEPASVLLERLRKEKKNGK